MHTISTAPPAISLRPFVSHYTQRGWGVADAVTTEPVPARIQHVLEFQFRDQYEIRHCDSDRMDTGHCVAVVGPQTFRRSRLLIHGHMDGFVIVFEPTGFYRLFGIEMSQFVNQSYDAVGVLGVDIAGLWERLGEVEMFSRRIEIVEEFLTRHIGTARRSIPGLTNHIALNRGAIRISDLARSAGLSVRQMEREFRAQVGLSPKAFARIQRFESALRAKVAAPELPWSTVAHELGYCDQMHMVHDFQDLSGESPTRTLARTAYGLSLKPQAWFAFSEIE